jgi:hypothetical protein
LVLAAGTLVVGWLARGEAAPHAEATAITNLPSFSEEREAAALFFVKKNAPDLLPLLERLRATDAKKYQEEIREIFYVTEMLSDLRAEDERRYQLELEIWKTEAKALIVVAKLASLSDEEQARYKEELQQYTRRLVDLDAQVLKLRIEGLERELGETRDELTRIEGMRDTLSRDRYERLFDLAKRRGMMK